MSRYEQLARLIDVIAALGHEVGNTPASPFGADLTRAQLNLLFALSRTEEATVSRLAATLGVTSAAISQTLAPLERSGLITAEPGPLDKRSRQLTLTAAARAQVQRFQQARIAALIPRFDPMSDAEIAATTRTLGKLLKGDN